MSEQFFSSEYLAQLRDDGEADVARKVCPIYARYSISVTSGTGTYDLQSQTREIRSITWKGFKVEPLVNQEEAILLDQKYETTQLGRPQFYLIGFDGLFKIRFIPLPDETIASDDTNLFSRTGISSRVIISYYRLPERSSTVFSIPDYLARRTIKPYVLSKAFSAEGKGQNLKASTYYNRKYEILINLYIRLKHKYFSRHEYAIGPDLQRFSRSRTRKLARLQDGFTINA